MLAEVELRGLLHAFDLDRAVLAEVDLIEVGLEDLRLAIADLEQDRHQGLAGLAPPGALGIQVQVLHELLGEGRSAVRHRPLLHVGPKRAGNPANGDAVVAVEVLVLGRNNGVGQHLRYAAECHRQPVLHLVVVDRGDELRLDADSAQRHRIVCALDVAHDVPIHSDDDRHGPELDVGVFKVLKVDLEVVLHVAVVARIGDLLAHFVVADVVQLRLQERARNRHPGHDGRGVRVDTAGQIPPPAGVEFLGDDDVGVADKADERDEHDHDEKRQAGRVAPEEVLDAGAFWGHPLQGYQQSRFPSSSQVIPCHVS